MSLSVIVLAAGRSLRFGSENKLLKPLGNTTILGHTLSVVKEISFDRMIAVCSVETAPIAEASGFEVVINPEPEQGQSLSLQLGLSVANECDGAMFVVADLPRLTSETLALLKTAFEKEPNYLYGCNDNGQFRIPSIFPASTYEALMSQEGDVGGREVVKNYAHLVRLINISSEELTDMDLPEDYEKLIQN